MEARSLFSISRPSPNRPIISPGDGSYLGVPCTCIVLGVVELEGGDKWQAIMSSNEQTKF